MTRPAAHPARIPAFRGFFAAGLVLAAACLAPAAYAINVEWTAACGSDPGGDPFQAASFQVPYRLDAYAGAVGSFKCNVKMYCEVQYGPVGTGGAGKNPRAQWAVADAKDVLLSYHDAGVYPEVRSLSDVTYLEPSGALGNGIFTALSDAASCTPDDAYRTQMDSAFNCAVWGAKHVAHQTVKDLLKGDQKFTDFIDGLDKKVVGKMQPTSTKPATFRGSASGEAPPGCRAVSCLELEKAGGVDLSVRLNNEATYQQCAYRYYLLYLDRVLERKGPGMLAESLSKVNSGGLSDNMLNRAANGPVLSTGASVSTDAGGGKHTTTTFTGGGVDPELVAGLLSRMRAQVAERDRRSVRSYLAALAAYQEFSRTYGPHILLQLIERDYVRIRDGLDVLLTPVSQALYKATNAMSSKGTK